MVSTWVSYFTHHTTHFDEENCTFILNRDRHSVCFGWVGGVVGRERAREIVTGYIGKENTIKMSI